MYLDGDTAKDIVTAINSLRSADYVSLFHVVLERSGRLGARD
jgi:hypothetical protein